MPAITESPQNRIYTGGSRRIQGEERFSAPGKSRDLDHALER